MQITSGRNEGETEVNQNKKLFIDIVNSESSSHKVPKVQVRKVSVAKWDDDLKLGVVIENKGCIWKNTGIIRNGKLYCHIEELLFLVDKGALILKNIDNTIFGVKDIILEVASGKAGCSWEAFLAYRHLKSLGYIVGRYNTPWTMKNKEVGKEYDWNSGHDLQVEEQISTLNSDMQNSELKPTFHVHFPNSGFKKSSPGDPGFILSVLWERPPSRLEAETLQKKCGIIPLKFCFVDHGRISFFSHQNFVLPTLQESDNEEIPEESRSISSLLAIIDNDVSSKIQCSNQVATNGYREELKSDVIEKTSDGKGNLDFHIKKTLSSVDEEVKRLECIAGIFFSKVEICSKLTDEKGDWSWEVLEAYDHLTSLGHIVECFNFPRTVKSYKGDPDPNILEFTDCNVKDDHKVEEICTSLEDMQISGLRPTFNVYCRNGTFKKISSGHPGFIVCVIRERPPSREEAENLQRKCGNVPLKFCFVDDRHVSFFSYEKIVLPTLA